jgi:hypothetical protein
MLTMGVSPDSSDLRSRGYQHWLMAPFHFWQPTTVPQFFCPVGGMRPAGTAESSQHF